MVPTTSLLSVFRLRPQAFAKIRGSEAYPGISGTVFFYQTMNGVLVATEVFGLPSAPGLCTQRIFAFHIHSGASCTGNQDDPFADALTHYNPHGCPHPYHAGDLPPLFGDQGYAFSAFQTGRFSIREIIGKTVIIHDAVDDFTSQPAGNAGKKIACGQIQRFGRW